MQLIFLGTSSMVPTKTRNHSAVLLQFEGEGILFDCGEGTQRQLKVAGIKPTAITRILLTHWHGDHVLGLPGLIQTLSGSEYQGTLRIYGPPGTKQRVQDMFKVFIFDKRLDFEVYDVGEGECIDSKRFGVNAYALEHPATCLGYRFEEKDRRRMNLAIIRKLGIPDGPLLGRLQDGQAITWKDKKVTPAEATTLVKGKVISYVVDTLPCTGGLNAAKDADLLIAESTYSGKLEEKGETYGHMTATQAARLASQAGAKRLILTHFSQRYKDTNELVEEAGTYFPNVSAADDFMKVKL